MGFFSWITQDTDRSICNSYSHRKPFKVEMMDNQGNVWTETDYEGYGIFGGKDYFELLAEMNGVLDSEIVSLEGEKYTDYMRGRGIEIAFKDNPSGVGTPGVNFPNLVETANGWTYEPTGPDSCPDQGYFYGSDDDEEEEEDY
jgi:hypothetical protein